MLKQSLQQKLSQKLSPQQIQLMKLIQLPTVAFEQRVQDEMDENPALDEGSNKDEEPVNDSYEDDSNSIDAEDINVDEYLSDDEIPYYKLQANNYSKDDEESSIPYASGKTLGEYLSEQISTQTLSNEDHIIAEFLIGNIDESGYIRRDLPSISDDLAFSNNIYTDENELERILKIIQQLDPPGIAARSLQECLSIQLSLKENTFEIKLARKIIDDYFEEFTKKHFNKIIEQLEVDTESIKDAFEEISKLNPKPGNSFSSNTKIIEHIIPDFIIRIEEGQLELSLNNRNAPELNISPSYMELFQSYKSDEGKNKELKKAVSFVKQKLDSAKWFIEAIKQRQETLYGTMSVIMNIQKEYFLTGDERNLKPMILKDVADKVFLDISTISRVVNSKYVSTPYGTFLLKEFFTESMKNEKGDDVSTREIKKVLSEIIDAEDKIKPLTDAVLVEKLSNKGYKVARRTVAKYREQLGYPVARLRKEITS
ncbi:MAG: RNA polymerase factor sigma-54 [Bacteroidota bacterium]